MSMAGHRRPSSRDGFEIAILCAVNAEVSAVESLFDEDWESDRSYGRAPGDANSYKIGSIANHNVVLAYLPETGINSAAKTAIWLKTSFTNINLALLVGVCSGVPSSKDDDIFLGDVVISTGIVHYDLGRLYPNVFSTRNGVESHLTEPPRRIRTFLAKLQAGETRRTLQENTYLNLLSISRMQSVAFPGATEDRLYVPSYRHKHQRIEDCNICAKCSNENQMVCTTALNASCSVLGCSNDQLARRSRVENADLQGGQLFKPKVHFGKMASGNFVVRSSLHRDEIASVEGIIAFETEGAAVWEELPTIIVKSVCDYADSHKNKDWQKYAACVAAACSRAIISLHKASNEETSSQSAPTDSNEFTIPPSDLRLALETKVAGRPWFWSYKMYCDSVRNTVNVHYSRDITKSEELACMLVDEPVLGFGMHWLKAGVSIVPLDEPTIGLHERHNISLVVLAKEDCICIFQLALHNGTSTEEKIAPTLKRILESPRTLKAGVAIFNFKDTRLLERFGINLKGIFELADLHNILGRQENLTPRREYNNFHVPIKDLIEEHLLLEHHDNNSMRISNWSRSPLSQEQISYAANDAYAGYQLFRTMDTKRLRMRPVPRLPLPVEQQSSEQNREREMRPWSSLKRRHEDELLPTPPSSRSFMAHEDLAEDSPTKRKRNNSIPRSLFPGGNPNALDPDSKFVWQEGVPIFNFGKHLFRPLQNIAVRYPGYLAWLTDPENEFSQEVVQIARDALKGIFPTPPPQDLNLPLRSVE